MPPKNKPTHRETTASTSVSVSDGTADRFIPPDIVFGILSRLPVKDVLRFKCVCKDWRKITSQEPFISAHFSRSPSLLLVHASEMNYGFHGMCSIRLSVPQSAVDRIDNFPGSEATRLDGHLMVIGSLPNGVVCVSQNLFSDKLILWNPATRSTRSIIAPKLIPDPNIHTGSSIGLGYDPSLHDIKIVRMLCHDASAEPDLVEFYSLNSGEWKIMKPDEIPKFIVADRKCDTVFEGVPYWKCLIKDEELGERHMLLSFLPKDGGFDVESIDPIWTIDSWAVRMGEIKGHLAAVSWDIQETNEDMSFQMIDVWLKCEDSIWKKLYQVGPMPAIGWVLGFLGEKLFVQESIKEGLRLFDLEKKDVTPFFMYYKNRVAAKIYRVVTYKESLSQIPEEGHSLNRSPSTI